MGIFSNYSVLNENFNFTSNLKLNILPTKRRGNHDAAIKVMMHGNVSYMELQILSNLDHKPTFDEIKSTAISKNANKDKDTFNKLVGFQYHYYDIIINFINNPTDEAKKLLVDAANEYSKMLESNPKKNQIIKFKPMVKMVVYESIYSEDDLIFDDIY